MIKFEVRDESKTQGLKQIHGKILTHKLQGLSLARHVSKPWEGPNNM